MVPHKLARKAIGKQGFVKAMARTLLYNLKGTSYGQSVLHFYTLLGKGLLKFLTKYLQCFWFSIRLHVFVKVQRPVARFKGLGQKHTFLGGHDFCFCYTVCLKQFFWAQRNLGSVKKLLPKAPCGYGRAQTSSVYFINWYIENHSMLITILQNVHRHIGMCQQCIAWRHIL